MAELKIECFNKKIHLKKIAEAMNVTIDELFTDDRTA